MLSEVLDGDTLDCAALEEGWLEAKSLVVDCMFVLSPVVEVITTG